MTLLSCLMIPLIGVFAALLLADYHAGSLGIQSLLAVLGFASGVVVLKALQALIFRN